ncbi:hypothetical protein [Caballeronia udeis]|jgi:hypothetical protein|uniref:hypothetical protein n=1 Tax=Caballeronia udeis TaxID=1232866 RepID=UPI00384A98DA
MLGVLPTGAAAAGGGAGRFPGGGAGAVCAAHAVAATTLETAAARASPHRFAVRNIDFEGMVLSVERHEDNCKPYAKHSKYGP